MGQPGDTHRFAFEARQRGIVLANDLPEDFDRDLPVEPRVPRPIHLAHAAFAQ